jgi:hypothetical protein
MSPQMLLDCNTKSGTCSGAYPRDIIDWMITDKVQMVAEADYPYANLKGTCKASTAPKLDT